MHCARMKSNSLLAHRMNNSITEESFCTTFADLGTLHLIVSIQYLTLRRYNERIVYRFLLNPSHSALRNSYYYSYYNSHYDSVNQWRHRPSTLLHCNEHYLVTHGISLSLHGISLSLHGIWRFFTWHLTLFLHGISPFLTRYISFSYTVTGRSCQALDKHDEKNEGNNSVHKAKQNTHQVRKLSRLCGVLLLLAEHPIVWLNWLTDFPDVDHVSPKSVINQFN